MLCSAPVFLKGDENCRPITDFNFKSILKGYVWQTSWTFM